MAVKSLLNPSSIVSERKVAPAKLENFITGGSPLGESVLSSAANKIVGFQRGASGVSARTPDFGSIINTLSSNILNNVENRVQSVNQNITQVVGDRLGFYDKELKGRLDKTESAKPSGILANFLKLYKDAIGYIQFLGNRKNIRTLGENIKELQKVFTETFEVAKIIRQAIVRIVKQLSNLPTASPTGGGLSLDIDVPGGPLRRTLPRGLANFGKMALAGGAIAGAGVVGGKVVSGMLDVGGEQVQPVAAGGAEGLSGPILDRFSSILDRFNAAIDSLSRKPAARSSGGGSKVSTTSPTEKTEPSSPSSGGQTTISSAPGDEKLAAFVASMEASTPENAADAMQVMLNRAASGYSKQGLPGVLSGYDQFSPISAAIFGKSADPAASRKYGPIAAKLPGKTPQEKFKYLQQIAAEPDGLNKLQQLFGGGSSGVASTILNDPKYLEMSRKNVKGALNFGAGSIAQPGDVKIRQGGNYFYNFTGKIGTLSGKPVGTVKPPSTVTAAPTQAATAQQVSQTVSQQPGSNEPAKSLMVPIDLTGTGGQQTQPATPPAPAPPPILNSTGLNVRSVSSTNFDNFYTIHSRLTFNIVE